MLCFKNIDRPENTSLPSAPGPETSFYCTVKSFTETLKSKKENNLKETKAVAVCHSL